jgi:phytoene desaturase
VSEIVIIGGGIAGLASAALLARAGHEVTLLEKHDELGGRVGVWSEGGFRFDTGPSWYLMPEAFDHFYRLLGTTAEEQLSLVTLDPGYRVYFEGQADPVDIAANRDENLDIFEELEQGAGFRLHDYLVSAKETYDLAKGRFLYTTFDDIRPVFAGDVMGNARRFLKLLRQPLSRYIARQFKDRRLRQILGLPAMFLGASPRTTPSLYHLLSHLDLAEGVQYPMGGFSTVIQSIAQLARDHGATIVTGADVQRIVVEKGAATGVEYRGAKGEVRFADADVVVSAADLHFTETRLLEEQQQTYPQKYWDARVPAPGALLIHLGVDGALPELEHHTLLFTKKWEDGLKAILGKEVPAPASLYICKPSGVDPSVAPAESENLFVHVPIPADPTIGHGGDDRIEQLADAVIEQIAEWTGIADLASRITVRKTVGPGDFADNLNSWHGSALGPAHTLKQSAVFRARNVSKKVSGLYYVGASTIPGVGLPMCLISAELLVKRLRGDVSTKPLREPLAP